MENKEDESPFFIDCGRAMISLGPLSDKKYCTYSCPFCYVHAGFTKYEKLDVDSILEWLISQSANFNIVYISGDTDSFAKPRTKLALDLLERLTLLKVDILFTTRYVFSPPELEILKRVNEIQNSNGKVLFGCVSVAQLTFPELEPKPISPSRDRINQLRKFKELGLCSVLAMRPFLPFIPIEEYMEIVRLCGNVDIVLGESWYVDQSGKIEALISEKINFEDIDFDIGDMDFNHNDHNWKIWKGEELFRMLKKELHDVPIFMRSLEAIEWYRNKQLQ